MLGDGASLVRNAQDATEELDPIYKAPPLLPLVPTPVEGPKRPQVEVHKSPRKTAQINRKILARLCLALIAKDQFIAGLSVCASEAAPVLVDVELDGQITRQSGDM